ncbi:MarR family winged helix-turn-helix transcriptional regulator [Clostridium grantii]|uniref:DNA-binding transcriptional regulator, MarR family n=1 Tax=Clostridium grantii DSM 8605 TaxID=1121316 RepID=A0A1M5XMX6_9CLOT|nr:MarR family winged helix-turn-helix transcriptional regulator [Clostridium grantii]SHI00908.1 DNA-binding transcriptional regulator, MarR family [Clostridium grantii DSM 8605]
MKADNTISKISRIKEYTNKLIVEELINRGYNGLAPSHGDIIAALLKKGEMTKTEISNSICRDRSTVTVLVRKLNELGYLSTRTNEEDSRYSMVFLTEKGKELKEDFIEISEKLYSIQYIGMTEEQIKSFKDGLEMVYDNFKKNNL